MPPRLLCHDLLACGPHPTPPPANSPPAAAYDDGKGGDKRYEVLTARYRWVGCAWVVGGGCMRAGGGGGQPPAAVGTPGYEDALLHHTVTMK